MKKERNSSFELLRLFCIFGIVAMHAFGGIDTSTSVLNTELHVLFNSLFNTAVTCFVLISGYFGIKFNLAKLIRMDLMVIFFSVTSTVIQGNWNLKMIVKAFFPVITRQHWFITCYFALCILAPFLNDIPLQMQKDRYRRLLMVLLGMFSVIPTLTTYDIMQDSGKGLAHFVMIYLLGRYLAMYQNREYKKWKLMLGFFVCVMTAFVLDSILTLQKGVLYNTFSRDCSLFMILAAVFLVLFFAEIQFTNSFINCIAQSVLAITVLDAYLRSVWSNYLDLNQYVDNCYFVIVITGYVLIVMISAILLNEIRMAVFGRMEHWFSEKMAEHIIVGKGYLHGYR